MFNFKKKKILIIAPHPDDEVFSCGGLIHRCKSEGGEVYVLYMTVGTTHDYSANGLSRKNERLAEVEKVAKFFKFDGYRIALPGDKYHLHLDSIPQRELINEIECKGDICLDKLKPCIVIAPSGDDYNQDHRAVNQAVITAVRPVVPEYKCLQKLILKYEPPNIWSDRGMQDAPNFYIELSEEDIKAKLKAVNLYKSQIKDPQGPFSLHGAKTHALMRGMQIGRKYAEAFFARRILISK